METQVRLQKFLADAGVASRRKAEEMIQAGRISVNGCMVTEMGLKVTQEDQVEVDGKAVVPSEIKRYVLLNKPVGYVSTAKDQFGRPTVLDLVKEVKERLYPVGRLDYDTSGLLILSSDGDFTYRLTHPKHEVEKVYMAWVKGMPDQKEMDAFQKGLLVDGRVTAPAHIKVVERKGNDARLQITIHEGRNRQVRKMCEAIGHPVQKLERVAIGKVVLGDLPPGKWRFLNDEEIKWLSSK